MAKTRVETDSMGSMAVPAGALYGAQTARAVENFPISGWPMPREFLAALGAVKLAAAMVNKKAKRLPAKIADAVISWSLACMDPSRSPASRTLPSGSWNAAQIASASWGMRVMRPSSVSSTVQSWV